MNKAKKDAEIKAAKEAKATKKAVLEAEAEKKAKLEAQAAKKAKKTKDIDAANNVKEVEVSKKTQEKKVKTVDKSKTFTSDGMSPLIPVHTFLLTIFILFNLDNVTADKEPIKRATKVNTTKKATSKQLLSIDPSYYC